MFPLIFGFIDSYMLMMVLGISIAIVIFILYFRKKLNKSEMLDLMLCAIVAIMLGLIFSSIFQNIYDLIRDGFKNYHFNPAITFYGGLIGGVFGFLIIYLPYYKKRHPDIMKDLLIIAPICVTLAHAIGRIGCFMAGCCYGIETDAWYGMYFPNLDAKVIPTNLFEAIFLFVLCGILVLTTFVFKFKYGALIYMFSYSIFRFLIEFIRGDERGQSLALSPSQIQSIIVFVGAIFVAIYMKKKLYGTKETNN